MFKIKFENLRGFFIEVLWFLGFVLFIIVGSYLASFTPIDF